MKPLLETHQAGLCDLSRAQVFENQRQVIFWVGYGVPCPLRVDHARDAVLTEIEAARLLHAHV